MRKLISWVEIPATDFNRAVEFYNNILGIEMQVSESGKEKMACLPTGEGAISYAPGFKPSKEGPVVSFNAGNNIDGVIEKIQKNGGKIIQPKTKIVAEGCGFFALFIDSEGNRIGLYGEE